MKVVQRFGRATKAVAYDEGARGQLAVSGPDEVRRVINAARAIVSAHDRLTEDERGDMPVMR